MSKESVVLIIIAILIPFLIVALSYYLLVYFQHPADKNEYKVPKGVLVAGLSLVMIGLMLVPFDVGNEAEVFGCLTLVKDNCANISKVLLGWQLLFIFVVLFSMFIIPWTVYYYENITPEKKPNFKEILLGSSFHIVYIVLVFVLIGVLYYFLRFFDLFQKNFDDFTNNNFSPCPSNNCNLPISFPDTTNFVLPKDISTRISVSFLVFFPAFFSFVSSFMFSIYLGIGLVCLPLDLLYCLLYKPRYLPKDSYLRLKQDIGYNTEELLEMGRNLQEKINAQKKSNFIIYLYQRIQRRRMINQFKLLVLDLEDHYNDIKCCHDKWNSYNPIFTYFKAICGVFCAIISFLWCLQILFSRVAAIYGRLSGFQSVYFLDKFFALTSKQTSVGFFGTIFVSIFMFYLAFAVLKGHERMSSQFVILDSNIIKYGETYISSLLSYLSVMLTCFPALISFIAVTLQNYIAQTSLNFLFNGQIHNLLFFNYFFNYNLFLILVLISVSVSFVYCMVWFGNRDRVRTKRTILKGQI